MTSLNAFVPSLRKLKVNSIFYREFSSTFKTVSETVCVVVLISNYCNFLYVNVNLLTNDMNVAIFVISGVKSMNTSIMLWIFANFWF